VVMALMVPLFSWWDLKPVQYLTVSTDVIS